jgi:two-component system sensor histidine kinase AgrC
VSNTAFFLLALLFIIPFYYLLIVPFDNHIKDQKRLLASGCVGIICFAVVVFTLRPAGGFYGAFLFVPTLYTLITGLALLYYNIDLSLPKLLYGLFLTKCYISFINVAVEICKEVFAATGFLNEEIISTLFSILFLLLLTMPSAIYYLRNLLQPLIKEQNNAPYWQKLWLIPCLYYILFMALISSVYMRNVPPMGYLTERLTAYIIWFLGTFMSCGILMQLLRQNGHNSMIQERLRFANLHLLMQRKEYKRLQDLIDVTRKQRHDMRQQLTVIKGLSEQNNVEGIKSYINNYLKTSQIDSRTVLCENYALNALMQYYLAKANDEDIATDIVMNIPAKLPIPETDVAAILGNLVENAIDACKEQTSGHRFVNVKANLINDSLIAITVRNSYGGEILRNGEAFLSTKRPSHIEGIGIASIRNIALRYHGVTNFNYDKNVFQASVLLSSEETDSELSEEN